jgi:transcriptional regulator with XRE-family HTH domain
MESVKSLRELRGRSQVWLAQKCECHATTISQIEHGRMRPSLERFALLSSALRVSPKRMLDAIRESRRLAHAPRATVTNIQLERTRPERRT